MLIATKCLPMRNDGFPLGTVLIAAIIIVGVGYLGYQVLKPIEPIVPPAKVPKNENG